MITIVYIAIVLVALYVILIGFAVYGFVFYSSSEQKIKKESKGISIVIAARNEEHNIENCLLSIIEAGKKIKIPFEIILVDDCSTDGTNNVIRNIIGNYSFVKMVEMTNEKGHSKKNALKKGVEHAQFNDLIFTDADVVVTPFWLHSFAEKLSSTNAKLVSGPVEMQAKNTMLGAFQQLDMLTLSGMACSSLHYHIPLLSNGANLAARKDVYLEAIADTNYFAKASGDDMFLLFFVAKKYGGKSIEFVKEKDAVVETKALENMVELWHQRRRWTSKSASYNNNFVLLVSVLVYLCNVSIFITGIMSFFDSSVILYFFLLFIAKSTLDFIFLFFVAGFYGKTKWLLWFIPVQFIYIMYVSIIPIAINGKYNWKGRSLR